MNQIEIEAQRKQIADAMANAAAQRVDGAALARNLAFARSPEALIPSPREWLKTQLNPHLARWAHVKQAANAGGPEERYGKSKALAACSLLDGALTLLGNRTGDRAESTRQFLAAQKSKIENALAAFESFKADLSGTAAQSLITRITASRAALASAYAAKEHATRETVDATLLEIERCLADSRAIDRDVATAVASLALPALPVAADFDNARHSTQALAKLPKAKPSALQCHAALDQGRDATPAEARLWIIYEPDTAHALLDLRWRRHAGESHAA